MLKLIGESKRKSLLIDIFSLAIIMAAGLVVRYFFYISINGPIMISDSPTYIDTAMSLFYHLGLNEYRPPVYPLVLAYLGANYLWKELPQNIIPLQIALSMVSVIFVYKLVDEAFQKKLLSSITALVVALNFRVYCWDFMVLTENFSILQVTLIAYFLIVYLKYRTVRHLWFMLISLFTAIFTKPFFLLLPVLILIILAADQFFNRGIQEIRRGLRPMLKTITLGFAAIGLSVLAYCSLNYVQNNFFGFSSVGSVNTFGKILQYHMEDYGNNRKLTSDIQTAFKIEKPEFVVNGQFVEPWHFIGIYGWRDDHYQEIGKFAKEIILRHPIQYTWESLKLTYDLFVLQSPFEDYIADVALIRSGRPDWRMVYIRKATEKLDSLYILLLVSFLEILCLLAFDKMKKNKTGFYTLVLLSLVLYHYAISAFLSYGDYCRLLAPCYPIIYILICLYLYRAAAFTASISSRWIKKLSQSY